MKLDSPREFALSVVQCLVNAGFEALWAGGCVRDQLLGIPPSDYDVATSATPQQVRDLFGHQRTLPVGMNFGVVVVLSGSKKLGQVEVATFRTDAQYSDGRRPDAVVFSSAKEDAQRRDFTINGMFYDPLAEKTVDYVGGTEDLNKGVIRAIGDPDKRIAEDRLRMLRGVRFAARFGFKLATETQQAIEKNAEHVVVVSGERIAEELRKTFQAQRASMALAMLAETHLLNFVLASFARNWEVHGQLACELLASIEASTWLDKFAVATWALLHADGDAVAETLDVLKLRLKFSNKELACIQFACLSQTKLEVASQRPWSEVQPLLIDSNISTAMQIFRARCCHKTLEWNTGNCTQADATLHETLAWLEERLLLPKSELDPPPLLTGEDLIGQGMRPGEEFKRLLTVVRNLQLDGQLTSRQEAINAVSQL